MSSPKVYFSGQIQSQQYLAACLGPLPESCKDHYALDVTAKARYRSGEASLFASAAALVALRGSGTESRT